MNQTKLITIIKDSIKDNIKDNFKNIFEDDIKDNIKDNFKDNFKGILNHNFKDYFIQGQHSWEHQG